jgi:hypothetical protein
MATSIGGVRATLKVKSLEDLENKGYEVLSLYGISEVYHIVRVRTPANLTSTDLASDTNIKDYSISSLSERNLGPTGPYSLKKKKRQMLTSLWIKINEEKRDKSIDPENTDTLRLDKSHPN